MGELKQIKTRDHDKIREWAESLDGVPTMIDQVEEGRHPQPLQIYFDLDDSEPEHEFSYRQVSWKEFFQEMDKREFALVYELNGDDPHYHEFVPAAD